MKRRFAFTLGALALGWLAGPAIADEPITTPAKVVVIQAAPAPAKPADVKAEPAPMPKDAVIIKDGHHHHPAPAHCDGCVKPDCGGGDTRIIAGIGVAYVKPHWEDNPAYFVNYANINVQAPLASIQLTEVFATRAVQFDWDYELSPRAWIGAIGCDGLGGRVSWMQFDHGAQANAFLSRENFAVTDGGNPIAGNEATATFITIPDPLGTNAALGFLGLAGNVNAPGFLLAVLLGDGDNLAFESDLKINQWDFEVVQEITNDCWSLLLAGGIRYAHISQSYDAVRFNSFAQDIGALGTTLILEDFAVYKSGHNFDGAGPTVAAELRRTVGENVALYGKARASLLYGEGKHVANGASALVFRIDPIPPVLAPVLPPSGELLRVDSFTSGETGRDDLLPIMDLELGAQFSTDVGDNRVVIGAGIVSSTYFGAGNASSENGNMGLFGIVVSAGLSY